MRHYFKWVGFICVVSVLFLAGQAQAEVPFADDLPDTRLNVLGTGSPTVLQPALDLDDYVIDNNNSDDALSWSNTVEGGGPTVNILAGNDVDVLGQSSAGVWFDDFTVDDPDTNSDGPVRAYHKYSSFWISEPSFTSDGRLGVGSTAQFTYVLAFDGSGSPVQTSSLVEESGSPVNVTYGRFIAHEYNSGTNAWDKVAERQSGFSATLGGLQLSVSLTDGKVFLTPSSALTPSCAVLVAIPAVLQGSTFDASGDWDGATILVAPAKAMEGNFPAAAAGFGSQATIAQNSGFENLPGDAPLQPDAGATTVSSNVFVTGGIRLGPLSFLNAGDASIVTAGNLPAGLQNGKGSGNVLSVEMGSGEGFNLVSFNITPVAPGEVYGISYDVATNIDQGAADIAAEAQLKLSVNTQPDNGLLVSTNLSRVSVPFSGFTDVTGLPTIQEGWRTVYTEVRIPHLNQAIDGNVNLMNKGLRIGIRGFTFGTITGTYNVYIDNLYAYCKGQSDINVFDSNGDGLPEEGLANGVTSIGTLYTQTGTDTSETIDGGFDSGADANANGWIEGDVPGLVTQVDQSSISYGVDAANGRLQTQGYAVALTGAAARTTTNWGTRFRAKPIAMNAKKTNDTAIPGALDLSGPGYVGVSFWMATDAADITENPRVKVTLTERRPSNNQLIQAFNVYPSNVPTAADGWQQYALVGANPSLGFERALQGLALAVAVFAQSDFLGAGFTAPYTGTNSPGQAADATVYFDDFVVHRVRDNTAYYNHSLFD